MKNIALRFDTLPISNVLRGQVKSVFAWHLENLSSTTVETYLANFRHFLQTLKNFGLAPAERIEIDALMTYRSSLKPADMWRLGSLSSLLRKWRALNIPGVAQEVIDFLAELRIPGNAKGVSVLTRNPVTGPLTDLEYETLLARLHGHFSNSRLSLKEYALALLVIALGQRPSQYASLKLKDFTLSENDAGVRVFTLNVPRSKQRGQLHRHEFRARVLSTELGELLAKHVAEVHQQFAQIFPSPGEAPLFPSQITDVQPPGFAYHLTSDAFTRRLKRVVEKLEIISTRTGLEMRMNTYRLRRTVGTRAAAEGFSEYVIAELLDHSDIQNVGVYVEAVPAIVDRIDRALAFHLAPMAQAFAGVLRERDVSLKSEEKIKKIWSPQYGPAGESVGNCGEFGFCNAIAPIACYTCRNFQPWVDGPHEAVLDDLLEERERLLNTTDLRIASICDRTILAVSEVILKCRPYKEIGQ